MAKKLTQLGRRVPLPASPAEATLESVANPHPGNDYIVRFNAPEFYLLVPDDGPARFRAFRHRLRRLASGSSNPNPSSCS